MTDVTNDKPLWLELMLTEDLKLEPVEDEALTSGSLIVGISALAGSFIPILPFMVLPISQAIWWSIGVSALVLFLAGVYKAKTTIGRPIRSGIQMLLIGLGAATAGYLIGRLFGVTDM